MRPEILKYKISNLLKNNLFWVLVVAFTVRNIYHLTNVGMPQNTDSVTYYFASINIFKGLIDASRTPIYPMLMRLSEMIYSLEPFKILIIVQHIISFLSIIPFYFVVKRITKSKTIIILFSITYGSFPPLLYYNYALFPEAILIATLVYFIYLFSEFIDSPNKTKIITINILLFILVMIKPVSVVIYGIMFAIWIIWCIKNNKNRFTRTIITSFIASTILLAGYCGVNKVQNDYLGITTVSHDNKFINVIFSGAYKQLKDEKFITTIDTTLNKGHYYTVFYLNNDHDKYKKSFDVYPLEYKHQHDMWGIYTIPPNPLGYSAKNIKPKLKKASKSWAYIKYMFQKVIDITKLNFLYINGLILYLLITADVAIVLKNIFRDKKIEYMRILNLFMLMGLVAVFIVGGVIDGTYPRVMLPLAPFLIIETAILTNNITLKIKNTKSANASRIKATQKFNFSNHEKKFI